MERGTIKAPMHSPFAELNGTPVLYDSYGSGESGIEVCDVYFLRGPHLATRCFVEYIGMGWPEELTKDGPHGR